MIDKKLEENLRNELAPTEHSYLSTACYHKIHDQCRLICKFCVKRCWCYCHEEPDGP